MSSFNRTQRSFFSRPSRTCSGLSILISCIETFATRFARLCNSCSSAVSWLTSKSPSNSASPLAPGAAASINSIASGPASSSITGSGSMCAGSTCGAAGGAAWCATGVSTRGGAGASACAIGVGTPGCGRVGSTAGSAPAVLMRCVICASRGDRCPGCTAIVTNRDNTSSAADSDAAEVCARNIAGSAFVGLLLAHAATMSPTAWCSSSAFRWIRSRFSRKARDTACSTAFGSCAIPGFGGLWLIPSAFRCSFRLCPSGAKPRFVIVEANPFRVNHLAVPMCPIVAYLPRVRPVFRPPRPRVAICYRYSPSTLQLSALCASQRTLRLCVIFIPVPCTARLSTFNA